MTFLCSPGPTSQLENPLVYRFTLSVLTGTRTVRVKEKDLCVFSVKGRREHRSDPGTLNETGYPSPTPLRTERFRPARTGSTGERDVHRRVPETRERFQVTD